MTHFDTSVALITWCNRPFLYFLYNRISSSFMYLAATYPNTAPTSLSSISSISQCRPTTSGLVPSSITENTTAKTSAIHSFRPDKACHPHSNTVIIKYHRPQKSKSVIILHALLSNLPHTHKEMNHPQYLLPKSPFRR